MKKIILPFLLLLPFNYCLAQNIIKYAYQKPCLGMKGKVEKLTEEVYGFELADDTVSLKLEEKRIFEFSEKGELKKKTISYDDYEKILMYQMYEKGRPMRFEQEARTPLYTNKDSTRLFIIDDRNEYLVSWMNYNHEYATIDTTYINYLGNRTEIKIQAHFRELRIIEERDDNGNLVRETRYLRNSLGTSSQWFYNEDNLLIGKESISFNYPGDSRVFYEYDEFDKQGNWLLKLVKERAEKYNENSELVTTRIVKRQIKYY